MSGFSLDWLDLRETADRRARDAGLLARAKHWLRGDPSSERRSTGSRFLQLSSRNFLRSIFILRFDLPIPASW